MFAQSRDGVQARARTAAPAVVAAGGSLVIACVALKLWNASLHAPWSLGGDDVWSVLLYVKTTLQHAWPTHNDYLGAPFGQDLQDYPLGDPLQIALTKLLGIFSSDPAVVTNLFFLLGFPLCALSALWAMRRLAIGPWTAAACAVLFAVAPYHFFRGEDHLLIAAYYTVPLAAYLVVAQLAGRPPGSRTLVVTAVLVGAGFTYYAVFALLLLAFAVVVSLVRHGRATALRGLLALAVIAGVLLVAHTPTWIYHLRHGGNPAVTVLHAPEQSERYGLKVPRMLFPVEGHRIGALASITRHFDERSPSQLQEGVAQALGLIAAAGFLALLWITFARRLRLRAVPDYLDETATASLAALLIGLSGGFGLVIVYSSSSLLRSWSRLSIFIAFFALVAVGVGLDRLQARLAERGLRPTVAAAALCALVLLGAADQTSSAMVPDYEIDQALWRSDAQFAAQAAGTLPHGTLVLELPYVPFPEPVYGQARPYLHTDSLRWTFGAMTGRPADWTAALDGLPLPQVLASAAAAGAGAVYVDDTAYDDGGAAANAALRKLAGAPLIDNRTSQVQLYDLRPFAGRLRSRLGGSAFARLGYLTLHPVRVLPGSQLSALLKPGGAIENWYRVANGPRADIQLVNPQRQPQTVDLQVSIAAHRPSNFTIALPDGRRAAVFASPTASGGARLTLRSGTNNLRITDTTPPPPFETTQFSLNTVRVRYVEAERLAGRKYGAAP